MSIVFEFFFGNIHKCYLSHKLLNIAGYLPACMRVAISNQQSTKGVDIFIITYLTFVKNSFLF